MKLCTVVMYETLFKKSNMNIQKRIKLIFSFISITLISCTLSNQNNIDPKVTTLPIIPSPKISVSNATNVAPTPSPVPSNNLKKLNLKGKIVYVKAEKDPNSYNVLSEIHIMNADGTDDKTLTTDFYDTNPKLSRDGSKIVFSRKFFIEDSYQYDIFTINGNGSNLLNVTNSEFSEESPCFSDDGNQIAYERAVSIYTINSNGSNEKKIITHRAFEESYYRPKFEVVPGSEMPNWYKNKIVFITSPIHYSGGYVSIANSDGTSMNSIDDIKIIDEFINFNPIWSSDGSKIVYGSGEILSINSDGSNKKLLATAIDGRSKHPSWSPDGTKVSFERSGEIYVINEDGTNQTKISKGYMPYWSL